MRIPLIAAATIALLGAASAHAEGTDIKPGEWEVTMQGAPHGVKLCITPDVAKDLKTLAKAPPNSDCKTTDATTSGSTRTFSMKCTKPNKYESTMALTVDGPESFSMKNDYSGTFDGKEKKGMMTMAYKRTGECKK
jgi:hypothetical protein